MSNMIAAVFGEFFLVQFLSVLFTYKKAQEQFNFHGQSVDLGKGIIKEQAAKIWFFCGLCVQG